MTGDLQDIFNRLIGLLPPWFGDTTPNRDAFIKGGAATVDAFAYGFYAYAKLQTRIKTATGGFLDLISADFFGTLLPRKTNESDESFRQRILITLLREKCTRNGIKNALTLLTGKVPTMFEPWRPLDCGGYNVLTGLSTGLWYNVPTSQRYGGNLPYQGFIDVFVEAGAGMANFACYSTDGDGETKHFKIGGYGSYSLPFYPPPAYLYYGNSDFINTQITDQEIYALINLMKMEGTICWTRINRQS